MYRGGGGKEYVYEYQNYNVVLCSAGINLINWYVYVIVGAAVVGFLSIVSFPVLYYCNWKRRHRWVHHKN